MCGAITRVRVSSFLRVLPSYRYTPFKGVHFLAWNQKKSVSAGCITPSLRMSCLGHIVMQHIKECRVKNNASRARPF